MTPGKTITWRKEKGKHYHLACNIEAVGTNIKWEKEEEDGNFREENQDKIIWAGEEY